METKKWTQLWLDYHKVYEGDGVWATKLEGFSDSQVVVANALYEFRRGIEALTGELVPDSGKDKADDGKTLTLTIQNNKAIPSEGYHIEGS